MSCKALHKVTGLSFGTVTGLVSVLVLLCWIPLRQRLGIGTVTNVVVVSLSVDVALALLPTVDALVARIAFLIVGIVLNGVATAAYIGARLGPGPRDGLMTGLSARTGISIRWVRTGIELFVLGLGWILGGTVGVGTVLYAVAIGPLAQLFLPALSWRERQATSR